MSSHSYVKKLGYADPRGYEYALIDLDALVPDPQNPRIPIQESALATLLELLRQDADGVFSLATDIVEQRGTNPAELLNVSAVTSSSSRPLFVVREGNRRVAARKLLRNPEQLKGHVKDAELKRWTQLAEQPSAAGLPSMLVSVIGADHEHWVDRRHLGPQGGKGLVGWDAEAKRRRDQRRTGERDLSIQVLDSLKEHHATRFAGLEPPRRTFTTFARVIESEPGRTALGLEVDETGQVFLRRGEQSLRLLEQILQDLRREGKDKLTSRTIHSKDDIARYLGKAKARIPSSTSTSPITLPAPTLPVGPAATPARKISPTAARDVMRAMNKPTDRRLLKVFEELKKARRGDMANAAIVLSRVLLELSTDAYATTHRLRFAGDTNPTLAAALPDFYKAANEAGVTISADIREALRWAKTRPMSLADKLSNVIDNLVERQILTAKEAAAKQREVKAADVVPLLNDAIHRLSVVPSIPRVNHLLEVLLPVFNAMTQP
jgi:hypothetical protein